MSLIKFFSILFTVYLVPTPSNTQEPFRDQDYSPKYYSDRSMHYFDIKETVRFTDSLILDIKDNDYEFKLNSILSHARSRELYEEMASSNKGHANTIKLLDDMTNSSNITMYEFTHNITLLFYHDFLRQQLYDVNKMCDYTKNIRENNTDNKQRARQSFYNQDKLIFEDLEIYDPDKWIQYLKNLDKLYSMELLPKHFDEFIQNRTEQALAQRNNCEREIPFNIKLLQCYQYLAGIERKRFIMEAAARQVKYACQKSNDNGILFDMRKLMIRRIQRYITRVKRLMKTAPREIRFCNLKENEESNCIEANRFYRMSLKEAVSNVDKNEIITAIAFGSKNDIIYPRIQTSILSSNGQVRTKKFPHRFDWEKLTNEPRNSSSTVDYLDFGGERSQIQSINLDDIFVGDGYVVTGVKFVAIPNIQGENIDGSPAGMTVGLQVRATQFDFATGKLGENIWMSRKTPLAQRTDLNLGSLDNPFKLNENFPDSVDGQYVKFRTVTSRENGNITVPFLDGRNRTILYTYPLGGVGLYHNGAPGSGGYISFKLISYDPSVYMNELLKVNILNNLIGQ